MFLDSAKLAMTEALRSAFDSGIFDVAPRYIGPEYPDKEEMWPAVIIQFHPSDVSWTGIVPDFYQPLENDPDFQWENIRVGYFRGAVNLQVFALTSAERDRLWDSLVGLVLMGELTDETRVFHDTIDFHDQISLTIQTSTIGPGGETISRGVPWDQDALAYDSTMSVAVIGQFFADIYRQKLVALTAIETYPYTDQDPVPLEGDGQGTWIS